MDEWSKTIDNIRLIDWPSLEDGDAPDCFSARLSHQPIPRDPVPPATPHPNPP